jgi:hypothetical protein
MIVFSDYITEEKANKEEFGSLQPDPKGKLHEILVGYHLRGGKHMDKHVDVNGKSPKEVHDEIAEKLGGVNSAAYKNFSLRSKKAAEHIKKELGLKDEDISHVHWTSKAGDMKRATGIDASQKEDDSDIVITTKNGKHHGVSLKVSDDNKPITLSNNGADATYGGDKLLASHKQDILNKHKALNNLTNADSRKKWLSDNTTAKTDIKKRNIQTLTNVAKNMHEKLSKMTPEQKSHHVRHIVLHAYSTPKEAHGHAHIRHFAGGGHNPDMHVANPSLDHEHILNDPENITTRHSGTSVYYEHKGVPFAMQTAKFSSQSDPLSSLVVVGKEVKRKKDAIAKTTTATRKIKPEPAPVAPDENITSKHIETNHPILQKKKLSEYRPVRTQKTFSDFLTKKAAEVAPSVSPIQKAKTPSIGGDHRQHISHEVGGFHFRDREQQ